MVVVDGVHKRYGGTAVLSGLDLRVERGEHVTLIGPSGSGKTTILRLLMGLEAVDAGTIHVGGRCLTHVRRRGAVVPADEKHARAVRRTIGMVFQQFNLFPNMTVLGNLIEAPVRVLGLSEAEATRRAAELLEMVGLTDKTHERPSRLSGGQQQRVAIARALAMRPEVLLLDEVTSALDPELVAGVLRLLRRIGESSDITILCVTHEIGFARDFSDRVLMFDGGTIIEDGPPEQLLVEPRVPRTEEFLAAVLEGR